MQIGGRAPSGRAEEAQALLVRSPGGVHPGGIHPGLGTADWSGADSGLSWCRAELVSA